MALRKFISLGSRRMAQWALLSVASAGLAVAVVANLPMRWVFAQSEATKPAMPFQSTPTPPPLPPEPLRIKLRPTIQTETAEQARLASVGCMSCHTGIEHPNMHVEDTVVLGCTDCHGGNAEITSTHRPGTDEYAEEEQKAHVQPRFPEDLAQGGHPVRPYVRWLKESYEFVKFSDPGDLRVAPETCGGCHAAETRNVKNSMMTHGAMLWGAALYNNGAYPLKNPHFGEAYDVNGKPERLRSFPPPTPG